MKPETIYTTYKCPLCGKLVKRESNKLTLDEFCLKKQKWTKIVAIKNIH